MQLLKRKGNLLCTDIEWSPGYVKWGNDMPLPQGIFSTSGDIFGCHNWTGVE